MRVGAGCLLLAVASAGAQPPDAVSRLKREGHVACKPSVPYFCVNLHVTCAGKTAVPTFHFGLRTTPNGAAIAVTTAAGTIMRPTCAAGMPRTA